MLVMTFLEEARDMSGYGAGIQTTPTCDAGELPSTASPFRRRHWFTYAIVSGAFALVLLVAAGLKARALLSDQTPAAAYPNRVASWAEIVAECIIAAWLLAGFGRIWSWRAAIGLLAVFIAVAGYRLLAGEPDCGCFGHLRVHPAWMVALDSVALTALWLLGPAAGKARARDGPHFSRAWTIVVLPVLLAAAVLGGVQLIFGRPLSAIVSGQVLSVDPAIATVQAHVDQVVDCHFKIRNISGRPIKVLGFNSDCRCATTTSEFPIALSAGETATVTLKVTVGKPGADGKFVRDPVLLIDREGMVPPLLFEANVIGSSDSHPRSLP